MRNRGSRTRGHRRKDLRSPDGPITDRESHTCRCSLRAPTLQRRPREYRPSPCLSPSVRDRPTSERDPSLRLARAARLDLVPRPDAAVRGLGVPHRRLVRFPARKLTDTARPRSLPPSQSHPPRRMPRSPARASPPAPRVSPAALPSRGSIRSNKKSHLAASSRRRISMSRLALVSNSPS